MAISFGNAKFSFTPLTDENYFNWAFRAETILNVQGLWKYVKDVKPDDADNKWDDKNDEALNTIKLMVDESQYVHLRGKTSAKTAWDALKEMHERNTPGSRVRLLRQIMVQKVDINGDIEAHIKNMNVLFQKFLALGDGKLTSNIFMNATLLGSLPDGYDTLITAMESRNEEELSTNYVQSTIIEEYRRRMERDNSTSKEGSALKVSTHNNIQRSQFSNAKQGNIKFKCYHCGGIGHFKRNCRKFQQSKDYKSNSKGQNANIIEKKVECDDFLFLVGTSDGWILDSGATCHICTNRDMFIDFDNSHKKKFL